jgi:hypothetical protein
MLGITLVGLVCSTVFHYLQALHNDVYPYNTFLCDPAYRYSDFTVVLRESAGLDPYLGNHSAQYPLLALIGYLLSTVTTPDNYLGTYYGLVIASCALLVFVAYRMQIPGNRWLTVILFTLMFLASYPFLLAVDRGNFELLVFALVALSLSCYSRQNYYLSGLALASAASMKLFPLYFLILFIREKKYKVLFFALGSFIAINLAILASFKGGVAPNLDYLLSGGNVANNPYFVRFVSDYPLFQKSASLYNMLKITVAKTSGLDLYKTGNVLLLYKIFALSCLVLFSWLVLFKAGNDFTRVTLVTGVIILFPYISAEYKMLYLFLPILYFLRQEHRRNDLFYAILFGLLMIPKSYYFLDLRSDTWYFDITVSQVINPVLIIVLLLRVLYDFRRQQATNRLEGAMTT